MAYNKKVKYSFGSWLGENAGDIIKTGAGTALLATGVGAPIGAGLVSSGAAGLAANNLTEDSNTQAALQTTGQVGGMIAGARMGYAGGGSLTEFNNGGTHEQNPQGGIPIGANASVEQGETKWQDYIFSDRIPSGNKKNTFADESKKIQKKYTRENDEPTQKALEREMNALMAKQEMIRQEMGLEDKSQMGDGGGITDTTYVSNPNDPRLLRYNANPEKFMFNKVVLQDSTSTPKVEPSVYGDKNTLKQAVSKLPINSQGQPMQSKPIVQSPKLNMPSNQYQVAMPKGYQPTWQHNPGIKGWQQAKDKEGKTIYRRVNEDNTYGPIEYDMGGKIEMAYGGLDPNSFNALNQTLNPNLGILNPQGLSAQTTNTYTGNENNSPAKFQTIKEIEAEVDQAKALESQNNTIAQKSFEQPSVEPTIDATGLTTDPSLTNQVARPGMDKGDYVAMGAQMLPAFYNLGKGLQKSKPIQYGRLNPNLVDYSSSAKVTNDAYDQQANIVNESIRENATSAGQALSNKIAHSNIAAKQKADALSQIGERQMNTNQQIRGSVDQSNLQVSINEEIANAQQDAANQQAVATGLGQIGQAAGTINRDRNSNRIQDETIQILGNGRQYTYVYNPVTKRREMKFINA